MLNKILDFFKRLFSSFSRKKEHPSPKPQLEPTVDPIPRPEPDPVVEGLPEVEPDLPQDGSEFTGHPLDLLDVDSRKINEEMEEELEEELKELEDPEAEDEVTEEEPDDNPPSPVPQSRFLWLLDNGHGKFTRGKRSPLLDDGTTRLFEYQFNRDVVDRIAAKLKEKGIRHKILVPEIEIGDFLRERVQRANATEPGDPNRIFVSVHSNAAPTPVPDSWSDPSISGLETWYFHRSGNGAKIAKAFQKHLVATLQWKNRGIKASKAFYVLKHTNMVAVLTENGFYNNKAQALELLKPEVRQKIADAHVKAILEIEKK